MADTIGAYLPRIQVMCPGASEMIVADAVLRAMTYVSRETRDLRVYADVTFSDGTAAYTIAEDGFRAFDFDKIWFVEDTTETEKPDEDLYPLEKKSRGQLQFLIEEDNATGERPLYWANTGGQEFSVYPFQINPDLANAALRVMYIAQIARPAAETFVIDPDTQHWAAAEDAWFYRNEEAIFELACYYLLIIPKKPWSSMNLARDMQASAYARIAKARSLSSDDGQPGVIRTVAYGGY